MLLVRTILPLYFCSYSHLNYFIIASQTMAHDTHAHGLANKCRNASTAQGFHPFSNLFIFSVSWQLFIFARNKLIHIPQTNTNLTTAAPTYVWYGNRSKMDACGIWTLCNSYLSVGEGVNTTVRLVWKRKTLTKKECFQSCWGHCTETPVPAMPILHLTTNGLR